MLPRLRTPTFAGPAAYAPAVAGGGSATFVGVTKYDSTGATAQTIDLTSLSPATGDLVVIQAYANSSGTTTALAVSALGSGSAFTLVNLSQSSYRWDEASGNVSTNRVKYFYRALDSSDTSGGNANKIQLAAGTDANTSLGIYIYRGGATSVVGSNLPDYATPTTTMTVTGHAVSGSAYGVLIPFMTRKTGGAPDLVAVTDWTVRQNAISAFAGNGGIAMTDRLSGYVSGNISQTFNATLSSSATVATLLELQ